MAKRPTLLLQAHLRANAAAFSHADFQKQQAELNAKHRNDAMKDLSPGDRCVCGHLVGVKGASKPL